MGRADLRSRVTTTRLRPDSGEGGLGLVKRIITPWLWPTVRHENTGVVQRLGRFVPWGFAFLSALLFSACSLGAAHQLGHATQRWQDDPLVTVDRATPNWNELSPTPPDCRGLPGGAFTLDEAVDRCKRVPSASALRSVGIEQAGPFLLGWAVAFGLLLAGRGLRYVIANE